MCIVVEMASFIRRGQIYMVKLESNGHIQGGYRPCVVIQKKLPRTYNSTIIVCPLTSKCKGLSSQCKVECSSLDYSSYALTEQIRAINISQLHSLIGEVENMDALDEKIMETLGLK